MKDTGPLLPLEIDKHNNEIESQIPVRKVDLKGTPAKTVLYNQAILSSVLWGLGNFCYSLLDHKTFAASCL